MRYLTAVLSSSLVALALCVSSPVRAEEYATVRNVSGNGFVQNSQDERPQSVTINTPLMEGDSLWTDSDGQVDVLLQDGNHIFLDNDTRIELDRLPTADASEGQSLLLRLWKGRVLMDLGAWRSSMTSYLASTPSASMSPVRAGLYLLDVESVDRTRAQALEGSCVVSSAGESVTLEARQMTYAEYGYPPLSAMPENTRPVSLLRFREASMPRREDARSMQYLPPDLAAYAPDLDAYGTWVNTDSYGYVWRPYSVPSDWAPYTNGRWVYNPWGMTWVPFEPWGWAPCHYGRWIFTVGFGWGWCPMPYFAPAWVSFWWGDSGWLGWCPMGYYGAPIWGPAGWYSVPVVNVYNTTITHVIVRHRTAPPPRPIYPVAKGSPAVLNGGGPRSPNARPASLNLPPGRVRDLRDGRISAGDLGRLLQDPINSPRRSFPSVQPGRGGDRGSRTEPFPYENPTRPNRPSGPTRTDPGQGRTTPADPRTPRSDWPAPTTRGNDPIPRTEPSSPRSRDARTEPRVAPRGYDRPAAPPARTEPPPRTVPDSRAPSYQPSPGRGARSERPSRVEPYRPPNQAPREPRYIPSRPPSGVGGSSGGGRQPSASQNPGKRKK